MSQGNSITFKDWFYTKYIKTILIITCTGLIAILTTDIYFAYSFKVNTLYRDVSSFISSQIKKIQIYDYTQINEDLASFKQGRDIIYLEIVSNDMRIGYAGYLRDLNTNQYHKLLDSTRTSVMSYRFVNSLPEIVFVTQIRSANNEELGSLLYVIPVLRWFKHSIIRSFMIVLFVAVLFYLHYLLFKQTATKASRPIERIANILSKEYVSSNDLEIITEDSEIKEIQTLIDTFNLFCFRLKEMEYQLKESSKKAAISQTASQVAHDIRSPLTALEIISQQLKELPEEKRVLIRNAVQRITDITNDLASRKETQSFECEVDREMDETYLVSGLIESIVSEKRIQYRSRKNVMIQLQSHSANYGLFVRVKANEFKRILSNLIDNAVEALDDHGVIDVVVAIQEDHLKIDIIDNGRGIPQDIIPQLMARGFSYGKEKFKKSGSGLGLYYAKEKMESFGGSILVESQLEQGTKVSLTLPMTLTPPWFLPEMILQKKTEIVVFDDDESIHQVWKGRLKSAGVADTSIHHFSVPENLMEWVKELKRERKELFHFLFLCDYEFINSNLTGLQVIKDLSIEHQSILVTSRYEEVSIREKCLQLGLKLLPKNLAGLVPIKIDDSGIQSSEIDAILIDDDPLVRDTWILQAKRAKKQIKTYESPDEFYREMSVLQKKIPIYIDAHLSNNIRGEVVSQQLANAGFENIYIATGYNKDDLPDMPWVKGVIGKKPPFGRKHEVNQ